MYIIIIIINYYYYIHNSIYITYIYKNYFNVE